MIDKLNCALEPALRQNKEKKIAFYDEVRDEIVGEKVLVYKK